MKIGFDLDGVICDINLSLLAVIMRILPEGEWKKQITNLYYSEGKVKIHPEMFLGLDDEFYIITSRTADLEPVTALWVRKFCPRTKLIMVDQEIPHMHSKEELENYREMQAKKKAIEINKLGLDVYFEDSWTVVQRLRQLCPKTKIICFGGRIE